MDQRERILEAAARVAGEKGFEAGSIRDIAAAAGVATGTLYIYFKGKRELMKALVDEMAEDAGVAEAAVTELRPQEALEQFVAARLRFLRSKRGLASAVLAEALFDREVAQRVREKMARPMRAVLRKLLRACGAKNPTQAAAVGWDLIVFDAVMAPSIGQEQSAGALAGTIRALAGCSRLASNLARGKRGR